MKERKVKLLSVIILISAVLILGNQADARMKKVGDYPSRPLTMVAGYGVGGGVDTWARMLAPFVTKETRTPVNVINVTGAGGEKAVMYSFDQPADGYTLFIISTNQVYHEGYRKVKHKMAEDFILVCNIVTEYHGVWVRGDSQFKTLEEFISYAKAHPGELKIAGHSAGGGTEISCHLFQYVTGTKLNYIPFGVPKANPALLGGHADVTFQKPAPMMGLLKAGKVRGLAIGGKERTIPDIPTFRELGYNIDLPIWRGIAVKKGVSPEIVKYLQEAFKKAIDDPTYRMIAKTSFFFLNYQKTKEFEEYYKSEAEKYGKLFKIIGWGDKK